MLPANGLQTMAAAHGLGLADPLTSFDMPNAAHHHTSTDFSPSLAQSGISNVPTVPAVPVVQGWNSTSQDNLIDKLGLSSLAPSESPADVITVTPTLPTAPSISPFEAGSGYAGLTWDEISQAADDLKHNTSPATQSISVLGFDDSGSNDVFSDAPEYQPKAQTSDGSIERTSIPKGLFANDTDNSSVLDEAVKGIRRGRDEVAAAGRDTTSAAADLAAQMGLATETSLPETSAAMTTGSAVHSMAIDQPRQHVREAFKQVSNVANETASDVASHVPDRSQVAEWQNQLSDAPSAIGNHAKESAQSAMIRADSVIEDTATILDKHIVSPVREEVVEPVVDTATNITLDIQSRIPRPSSAAEAISATISESARQVKDQAQSTIADTSRAIDRGVEALPYGADDAKSSVGSALHSLPAPSELAKDVANDQRAQIDAVTSTATTNPPSQSVFDSWSSDDGPGAPDAAAREAASTLGERFKGGLHNFGIDLGRMRQQTSAAARSGYDNTATALQSGYQDTASTVGGWYRGAADTASNWTSRVGQAFKRATPTIDSELSEPPRPVISAPLSVQTTVDPFADVKILDPKSLDNGLAVASIPTQRTDLTNGGWLKSLRPDWWRSKTPTTSVADSAFTVGDSDRVSVAPTSPTLPEFTAPSAPSSRGGWFSFGKKSAPSSVTAPSMPSASVTASSVPSASRPSALSRTSRRKPSAMSKYGRPPNWLESTLGVGPGRHSKLWTVIDTMTGSP